MIRWPEGRGFTLTCAVYESDSYRSQVVTDWNIYTESDIIQDIQTFLEPYTVVEYGGTPLPIDAEDAVFPDYRNDLIIQAFPSILHGLRLYCGTDSKLDVAEWPLEVYSKQ